MSANRRIFCLLVNSVVNDGSESAPQMLFSVSLRRLHHNATCLALCHSGEKREKKGGREILENEMKNRFKKKQFNRFHHIGLLLS